MDKRNYQIQGLRGIGCLIIVFYHLYYRYREYMNMDLESASPILRNYLGSTGVNLFLIITGYFICTNRYSLKKYLFRRFKNLYPPYLLAITVTFLTSKILQFFDINIHIVSLKNYILNVFLLSGFIHTPYVDGAHWYLYTIITFTVIMAVIIYLIKKSSSAVFYFCWVAVCVLLMVFSDTLAVVPAPLTYIVKFMKFFSGGECTTFIVIGITFKKYNTKVFSVKETIAILFMCFVSVIVYFPVIKCVIVFATTILCGLAFTKKLTFMEHIKPLLYLGDISYIVYLVHQMLSFMIMYILQNKFYFSFVQSIIVAFVVVIVLSIGISKLFSEDIKYKYKFKLLKSE